MKIKSFTQMRWVSHCLLLLLIFCFSPTHIFAQNADGWIKKSEEDGIKVYYRKTSDVHELKLVTSLKVPLPGLVKLLSEVENYPRWGYKVTQSAMLNKVSEWECYYYSRLDFPWPLDDRDIIVRSTFEQDPVSLRITATSISEPEYLPVNKGVVRMCNAHTQWIIMPGTEGWTYIEYYIYSDPGGSIPDWLVNMAIDVGPKETIKNMRNFVRQEKYQTVRLAYIKE